MSEAPKKIWMAADCHWATRHDMYNIPYIRADIVDELVEALERLIAFHDDLDYGYSRTIELDKAALAKLKKLEESHE